MLDDANITEYVKFAEHLYLTSQGQVLSKVISIRHEHVLNKNLWYTDMTPFVVGKCVAPLDGVLINHLSCVRSLHGQNYVEAFNYQNACAMEVIKLYQVQQETWLLPVIYTVCLELRLTAQKADAASNSNGAILNQAIESLMACCRLFVEVAGIILENRKKVGLLCPVNHVLKIYFKTHQFNLCQWMIRDVQPLICEDSSISQMVTFNYYVGRLAVLESNYTAAEEHLSFAFNKCHPDSYKNKRMILSYLLPVKMILGYMPLKALIDEYDLPMLWDLMTAVKDGNLKKFKVIVQENIINFEDAGLFSALENLRVITYRNVFKKVYLSQGCNKIPISCFQAGLQLMSDEVVNDGEAQCVLAMLIYKRHIQAYMSYVQQVVYFNRDDPFPRLSSLYHMARI